MRRMGKRIFAAVLAAALLFAMPGMTLYAEAADGQGESVAESVAAQAALDAANEPVTVDEPTEGDVARVEMPDGTATYVSALAAAFVAENSGATVTLLQTVDLGGERLIIPDGTAFTLEGGTCELTSSNSVTVQVGINSVFTLLSGTLSNTNPGGTAVQLGNTGSAFTMSSGTVSGTYYAISCALSSTIINISGGEVTGGTMGLINSAGTVKLSGGTYSSIFPGRDGTPGNYTFRPVSSVLAPGCALKGADGFIRGDATGNQEKVTVVECTHPGVKGSTNNDGTHSINCSYCGYTGTADCSYTFKENENVGTCTCGDKLTVVADPAPLTYNGTAQEPGVTVKRGDTVLAASAYSVTYGNNTNAGTALVTVTIGNGQGACKIKFPIGKATPDITALPTAARITYGQTLGDSVLSGGAAADGSTAIAGTFGWKTPSAKPTAADSGVTQYTAVFTPDSANYNPVEITVTLTVQKAPNVPNMPDSAMRVPYTVKTAGSAPLPEGWAWQASDRDTALAVDAPAQAVAVYTGADKDNYENLTVTVTLTRAACGHAEWEILYTGEGEKAPACTGAGLGHKECAICGDVLETGIASPALGHAYKSAVTTQPSAGSDGVRTYTCTRCGDTYTEAIEKLPGEDTENPDGEDEEPKDNPQTSLPEAPDEAGGGTAQTPPPAQSEAPAPNDVPAVQSPQTDHPGSAWLFVVSGILAAAAAGTGIFFLVKKKRKDV